VELETGIRARDGQSAAVRMALENLRQVFEAPRADAKRQFAEQAQ